MKTLVFLDCPTGIAGDMCLGALVSAGVPLDYLQTHLARLNLPETFELQVQTVHRNGIAATKVEVVLPHETTMGATLPPVRHLGDIEQIITAAQLPNRVTQWSIAIFRRLAKAEGAIHGTDPQQVHFHEVGATDAIVDIVGTCLGLDWLRVDAIYCAPLPTGRGTVHAAHGRLPVPVPAVLKLMEMGQVPIYNSGLQGELVTPTGAAIATELAIQFGDPPAMQLQKVGLGAGNKDFPIPNILRLWIGKTPTDAFDQKSHTHSHPSTRADDVSDPSPHHASEHRHPHHPHADPAVETQEVRNGAITDDIEPRSGTETVVELETQVDDLSPQAIGYLYERLLQAGALDVFTQGVTMKKSRPGHLITVITYPEKAQSCERILLQETTTLGVRRTQQSRFRLRREIMPLETPLGIVRMKLAYEPGHSTPLKAHPEYEDCANLARQHKIPWRVVHQQTLYHWQHFHLSALPKPSTV